MTFIVGVVMTFVWFSYGRLVNDHNIMTVNVTGKLGSDFFGAETLAKSYTRSGTYIRTGSSIKQPSQT